MAAHRAAALLAITVLAAGAFALLGPVQLGGPASYVVVDGTSMEPTYADGDLVVARQRASYEVGDIVTFEAPDDAASGYRVIHRIIDVTSAGYYLTQGDNRDRMDPWPLTDKDILGASLVRIRAIGGLVRTDQQRATVLAVGAGLLALGAGGAKVRQRRRHCRAGTQTGRRSRMVAAKATKGRNTSLAGPNWAGPALVVALLALAGFGWLVLNSLRTPATETTVVPLGDHAHRIDYSYTAHARPSLAYPDGQVGPVTADARPPAALDLEDPVSQFQEGTRPPQVLYRTLVNRLTLTIDHQVEAGDQLAGEHRTFLVVRTADGWVSREPLGEPVAVQGGASSVERVVNLRAAQDLLERVAELADTSPRTMFVAVESEIEVAGSVGGHEVEDVVTETFELRVAGDVIEPSGYLARVHEGQTGEREVVTANTVLGMSMPWARGVGAGGVLLALLAGGWLAATVFLGWRRPEHEGIEARYGNLIVTVQDDPIRGAQPMRVASMAALARLAKREHTAILHEPRVDGSHRYVVPDGLVALFYETGARRERVIEVSAGTARQGSEGYRTAREHQ